MRDYGKVHSKFWSSDDIRSLTDDGRLLALYLMTSPHSTIAGVFRLPDGYVCEDMQWTPEQVAQAFGELLAKGFANRCETTKWVWVTKHLEWNPPENPNQRKSAAKVARGVPAECCWQRDFMRVCGPSLGIEQHETHNPSRTLPEPFANQEQEQEQKEDTGSGTAPRAAPPTPPPDFDGRNAEALNGKAIVPIALAWELPEQWGVDAESLGWQPAQVLRESEKFRQYWVSGRGKGTRRSVKGWRQAWSNWLEKAAKDHR